MKNANITKVSNKAILYTGFISIILFFIVGFSVNDRLILKDENIIQRIDYSIAKKVELTRAPEMTSFMASMTNLGDTGFASKVVLVMIVVLALCAHRKFLFAFVLGVGLVVGFVKVSKIFFDRARPGTFEVDGLSQALIHANGGSYPSGHTAIAIFFLLSFSWLIIHHIKNKYSKVICISLVGIVSIFICISRVYLGVHFFSDVIGGALLAISFGAFSLFATRHYFPTSK